jgi:hypothetical protein
MSQVNADPTTLGLGVVTPGSPEASDEALDELTIGAGDMPVDLIDETGDHEGREQDIPGVSDDQRRRRRCENLFALIPLLQEVVADRP